MQLEVFITLFLIPMVFFWFSIKTRFHVFGIFSGLYLFFMGLLSYSDPLEYKTGMFFSGVNQSNVTYVYTQIGNGWIYFIGLILMGLGIIIMIKEAMAIWGR